MERQQKDWWGWSGVKLADILLRHKVLVLVLSLILTAVLTAGTARIEVSGDYRAFFDKGNPELLAFDAIEDTYARLDSFAIVVRPKSGDLFTRDRLELLRDTTVRLWDVAYVSRVDSLTNHQHSWAEDDDLFVEDLVPEDSPLDAADIKRIRTIALSEPTIENYLMSPDGRTASLIVTLNPPEGDENGLQLPVKTAREIVDDLRAKHPDFVIALVGGAVLDSTLREVSERDAAVLFPLMLGVLFFGLWAFYKSPWAAGAVTILVVASVSSTLGIMGYMDIPMMTATAALPVIVLTIAVTSAIHIVTAVQAGLVDGLSRRIAIMETMRLNFEPVIITSATTVFGFIGLVFSETPPYRDVGILSALGTVLAVFYTLVVLPSLLAVVPLKAATEKTWGGEYLARTALAVAAKPKFFIGLYVVLTVAACLAVTQLKINDKFVDYFSDNVPFKQDATFVSEHLPGLYFLEFSIASGEEGGINEPAYLKRLDAFASWLKAQPGVTHVSAITDIMKRLNRNMHDDDPDHYKLPSTRNEAAQYLLLYEMSLPFGRDLNNQIDVAKSASRVTVVMGDISTGAMHDLERASEAWLKNNTPTMMHADGTGVAIIFAHLTERTLTSMIGGTLIGFAFMAVCIQIALRSLSLSFLSVIVNISPVAFVFAVWWLMVGEIGLYAAVVATVSLGFIVDFAIHILSKYKRLRSYGADLPHALTESFLFVGPPLLVTTVVLVAGFLTLVAADFTINAYLGIMTGLVIALAFVTDFVFLPALLTLFDRERKPRHHAVASEPITAARANILLRRTPAASPDAGAAGSPSTGGDNTASSGSGSGTGSGTSDNSGHAEDDPSSPQDR